VEFGRHSCSQDKVLSVNGLKYDGLKLHDNRYCHVLMIGNNYARGIAIGINQSEAYIIFNANDWIKIV
jgi:hypothetical protein